MDELPEDNAFYSIRAKLEFWEPSRVVFTRFGFLVPPEAELKVLRAHHGDVVPHVCVHPGHEKVDEPLVLRRSKTVRLWSS